MPISFRTAFASPNADDPGQRQPEARGNGNVNVNGGGSGDGASPADTGRDEAVRRSRPRALAGSALAALKELGPRLTPAQRTSIDILEKYDRLRGTARYNEDLCNLDAAGEPDGETETALSRRASFLLISPTLAHLDANIPDSPAESHAPVSQEDRAVLTAQAAAAHELIETVKHRAIDSARSGVRMRPLTLEPERFQHFLDDNKDSLRAFIDSCDEPSSRSARQHYLEQIATRYLAERGIAFTGMHFDPRMQRLGITPGAPLTINIRDTSTSPQHLTLDDDDCTACLIELAGDGIEKAASDPHDPGNLEFGLTTDFAGCAPHERQAAVYLQHLFLALADIEQEVTVSAAMEQDEDFEPDEDSPAFRTASEKTYEGSQLLGDDCAVGPHDNQREALMSSLLRLRRLSGIQDANDHDPLLTLPVLQEWVRGVEFRNDCEILRSPAMRLEHAQQEAVAAALRATGVFATLPEQR